jgi:hypothetical protein
MWYGYSKESTSLAHPMKKLFEQAAEMVDEDRWKDYGDPDDVWEAITMGWRVIFAGGVTIKKAHMAMTWMKICRELKKPKFDNAVDGLAYLWMAFKEYENGECKEKLQGSVDTERGVSASRTDDGRKVPADRDFESRKRARVLRVERILGRVDREKREDRGKYADKSRKAGSHIRRWKMALKDDHNEAW